MSIYINPQVFWVLVGCLIGQLPLIAISIYAWRKASQ